MSNRLVEPLGAVLDRVPESWRDLVVDWRGSPAGQRLEAFVARRQHCGATIYPRTVLRALELTPRQSVRVVILGQDPYHRQGQAEGLAFSVPPGERTPPSLRNILLELQRDLGQPPRPTQGHLGAWARRGVLLLNTVLTVEDAAPGSHAKQGWEALTDGLIEALADDTRPKAFLLWGAHAQARGAVLRGRASRHLVLMANHPSPLSARRPPAPFLGCGHFSAVDRFFAVAGERAVDWSLG